MKTDIVQLLHILGHGYGGHGQTKRAIVLLILATWLAPDDAGVLRTLAYTFLLDGEPETALNLLAQIDRSRPRAASRAVRARDERGLETREAFDVLPERLVAVRSLRREDLERQTEPAGAIDLGNAHGNRFYSNERPVLNHTTQTDEGRAGSAGEGLRRLRGGGI